MNLPLTAKIAGLAAIAALTIALAVASKPRHAASTPPEAASTPPQAASTPPQLTVFKDANCGCCTAWVDHVRTHGFTVATKDTADLAPIKDAARVPADHRSCHTAFVDGYVIEGHVPADDIKRLLAERPKVAGLAVGGMPVGSPGMELGSRRDPYDVVAFTREGVTSVFARY